MKSTALFFIVCLAFSAYAETTENFDRLEKTAFGRNLLDTINLQLKTNEPISKLMSMLTDMGTQLANEQAQADSTHEAFQARCSVNLAELESQINNAQAQINEASSRKEKDTSDLSKARSDLNNARDKKVNLESQLSNLILQRNREADEYKKRGEEKNAALAAIDKARSLFEQLKVQPAFLQRGMVSLVEVTSNLNNVANNFKSMKYKSLFTLLASIMNKAPVTNQEVLGKVLSICSKIVENINQAWDTETSQEEQRKIIFGEKKNQLDTEIIAASSEITRLNELIAFLESDIANAQRKFDDQTERYKNKVSERDATVKSCTDELNVYGAEKKRRDEERSVVSDVITIVKTRLSNLSSYLRSKVENVSL